MISGSGKNTRLSSRTKGGIEGCGGSACKCLGSKEQSKTSGLIRFGRLMNGGSFHVPFFEMKLAVGNQRMETSLKSPPPSPVASSFLYVILARLAYICQCSLLCGEAYPTLRADDQHRDREGIASGGSPGYLSQVCRPKAQRASGPFTAYHDDHGVSRW